MSNIKLFESQKIRSHWDAEKGKWYFSIVDIISTLTAFDGNKLVAEQGGTIAGNTRKEIEAKTGKK